MAGGMSTMQGGTAVTSAPDFTLNNVKSGAFYFIKEERKIMQQLLSVVLHRHEDTLLRLAGLCYRRGVPIESLAYFAADRPDQVKVQAVLACEQAAALQLQRQVSKLIDVVSTEIVPN